MSSSKPTAKSGIKNVPAPEGSKPTAYSRFIPREELNSFAAWNPSSLTGEGGDEPVVRGVQKTPPPEPPRPSPAEEMAALVRSARQQGYQDGYRDGMAALENFKQSYASQITAQVGALTQSLTGQLEDLQQDMARALAVSATHLARQIVRSELVTRPELVVRVAEEALEALMLSATHITLRVHPDDHVLVMQGAADVLAARGARVISDATLLRGGCMVESDIGIIDASIETRWRRAAAALGCDEGWGNDEASSDGLHEAAMNAADEPRRRTADPSPAARRPAPDEEGTEE
jgi:flagellar assembly protein FliH